MRVAPVHSSPPTELPPCRSLTEVMAAVLEGDVRADLGAGIPAAICRVDGGSVQAQSGPNGTDLTD